MNGPPLTLLTGASRGLGLALARQRLVAGHELLTLSRSAPPLTAPADRLTVWRVDLGQPQPLAARLAEWLAARDGAARPARVDFIHNAALLATPAPLAQQSAGELSQALRVGLEAPLLLSAVWLAATAAWGVPRRLLFVSSGLGRRAMAGSAAYGTTKAGLDHLARGLALEQALLADGARVASLAPGVIDTDMQVQLRGADPARFPEQARFAALHDGGALDSAETAAAKVLRFLDRDDFGSQPVADVREG